MTDQLAEEALRPPSMLGLLRRRWYAIAIPFVVVGAAAFGLSSMQEKEYEASTSLLFRDAGFGASVLASQDPEREAATNVRLLQLGVLDDRVDARLGGNSSASVDVIAEADSNLATITATARSPKQAARAANLYAQEYIALRQETARQEIEQERNAVEAALSRLTQAERAQPEGRTLEARKQELALAAAAPSGTRHVNPATPPSAAASPDVRRNTALGAVLGLLLGVGLAIWLERRDRRLRDPREMEAVFNRPIVGRIPRSRAISKLSPGTTALPPAEAEAFRTLRANLNHLLGKRGSSSVLVTSAYPREGKTTVAWNLARAAASAGANVLLVEADMRRPVLARSLGANGAAGLSQLLSGQGKLPDVVQTIDFDGATDGGASSVNADVLVAGAPPINPTELLDSGRMQAVLAELPDTYDLIVVDTPPASVVSDAVPILGLVDGVLVVGRLGLSTYESSIDLRDRLEQLDARILGIVVNADAPDHRAYAYYQAAPATVPEDEDGE